MLDTMMKVSLTLMAFDKMSRVIRDAVQKSNDEFNKLQKKVHQTSESIEKLGKNMMALGAGMTVGGLGLAHTLGLTDAIPQALEMEHRIRELGNVGQLTEQQLAGMDKRLGQISKYTNQFRPDIIEGLSVLVASGVDPTKALDYMNVIGKTATAEQAAIVDISKTAFSVTDNLKVPVSQLGKTMDILAQSGKEGRFELKDMAGEFPGLTASASMLGMKGVPAVAQLGAALQIAMKGAKDAPEAANNLQNFMQKVTAPQTIQNFSKKFGIDLKSELLKAISQGKDPILEMMHILQRATGGDVFKVSEIFQDMQVLNFIKPMMKNLKEYEAIKRSALSAQGVVDNDYQNMMKTTLEQWNRLKINMMEIVLPNLAGPLKKANEILEKINSNPILQKGIFAAIIGLTGGGILLTILGGAVFAVGNLVNGYGKFLQYARDLTPILKQNTMQLLKFMGLNTTFHNLETASKLRNAGNPLGIDLSKFSFKSGIFADIRRIDNNLRAGIIRSFKEFPSNTVKATASLKDWTIASIRAVPSNFMNGLRGLKAGFLDLQGKIRAGIIAFRAFSLTLLTSPIGWIALAIGAAAFLIYKYWKPITGFFRGVFKGLRDGLAPLQPAFNSLAKALSPILAPLKAVWEWFKKLIQPVNDTGGAAEKMGVKFGKVLAQIILKITDLIKKMFQLGAKVGDFLSFGMLSKTGKTQQAIGKHAQIIRDHLPHSPAKMGPLKDLHKIKLIETIAATIKPAPLFAAMNKALSFKSTPISMSRQGSSGGTISIHYNPTISINGASPQAKEDFAQMLKQHSSEIEKIVKNAQSKNMRLAY
ncbi:MAG: phage tail tape measure protein [Candidatus Gastranaerophilales bacterium]|nr:phage tail tape measure protein [Candidatus Gastranaerophilales bacterium]